MAINYFHCARLLCTAFQKSGCQVCYDAMLMQPDGMVANHAPELHRIWMKEKSRPDAPKLSSFIEACVLTSNDRRLRRMRCDSAVAGSIEGTYYYQSTDGEPSSDLVKVVARFCEVSARGRSDLTLEELMQDKGMGPVLTQLGAYYGGTDALARHLGENESSLMVRCNSHGNSLWSTTPVKAVQVVAPPKQPQEERAEEPKAPSVRELLSADDENSVAIPATLRISGYPPKAWALIGQPESKDELARLDRELDCVPFDRHASTLSELVGYDGSDVDSWRAIFARDWRQSGTNPTGSGGGWWRSTNLCDTTGRQIFALLREGDVAGRWVLDRICSADEVERELGVHEFRPPRPLYHTYDMLDHLAHKASSAQRKLRDSRAVENLAERVNQGKEPFQSDLMKIEAYAEAWQRVRDFIAENRLTRDLGISTDEMSADAIINRVTEMQASDDTRSEWISLLRRVISGCGTCFESIIWQCPTEIASDLETVAQASEHFSSMQGWLEETSNFYIEMVETLTEAESYDTCGESLTRIEEHLGGRSMRGFFGVLCKSFREADAEMLPVTQLVTILRRATGAVDHLEAETQELTSEQGEPKPTVIITAGARPAPEPRIHDEPPIPATPLAKEAAVDAADWAAIVEMRHEEKLLAGGSGSSWAPPVFGREQADETPAQVPEATTLADSSKPDPISVFVKDYDDAYDCGLKTGKAADLVQITGFGGELGPSSELEEGVNPISALCYGFERPTVGALNAAITSAIADHIRPAMLNRIYTAFEDPDEQEASHDVYLRYLVLRTVCERLATTTDRSAFINLEYYALQAVDAAADPSALTEGDRAAIVEALLLLATHQLKAENVTLLSSFADALGKEGKRISAACAKILETIRGSYLGESGVLNGGELISELNRSHGSRELDTIATYAKALGPGTYKDRFSGSVYLWNWLMGAECDPHYVRVREMVRAMAEGGDCDPEWNFEDRRDMEGFLDDSFAAQLAADGRPRERMTGSPRDKFLRQLTEIGQHFDRYCSLHSSAESTYVDPLLSSLSVLFMELRDAVVELTARADGSVLGELANHLASSYPANILPWDEDGPIPVDGIDYKPSDKTYAFVELQQHYTGHRLPGQQPQAYLPDEDELLEVASLGVRAYMYNVIDASARDSLKAVLAGTLGARRHYLREDSDCLGGRIALWCYEYERGSLDHKMKAALHEFRESVAKQLEKAESGDRRDESRAKSLREMLGKIDSDSSPETVLSYGDFLVDTHVAIPARLGVQPDDLFYGSPQTGEGVHDAVRSDLESQEDFYPNQRISCIPSDINATDILPVRNCLKRIGSLVRRHKTAVNGEAQSGQDPDIDKNLLEVAMQLETLFTHIGFEAVSVAPAYDENRMVAAFNLDFLSNPGSLLSDGSPVCPLRQLVNGFTGDLAKGTNARLSVEMYTTVSALFEGAARKETSGVGRRVALYLGHDKTGERRLLTLRDRTQLANKIFHQEDGTGFLLLDWVLLAYALHWKMGDERLGTFFRCASQFTHLHPFVDKGLPSEARVEKSSISKPADLPPLFYGRSTAVQRIRSFGTNAAYIVYGARRMGKTSILSEVEAILTAERAAGRSKDIAAYCDIRGHTGGGVDNFWTAYIASSFERLMPGEIENLGDARSAKQVQEAFLSYMRRTGARLIILLDEADFMVSADAQLRELADGSKVRNAIIDSLYNFTKMSGGSFKFVLCGLHGTMRLSGGVVNSVAGHLGDPQVIAPLWEEGGYVEAYRLVYEPLRVMGVRLSHESILTIIRRAGYYPNLINQVCERLLEAVRLRRDLWASDDQGPCVQVGSDVLEEVFAHYDEVLSRNFDETIALDYSYRAIVHAMVLIGIQRGWGLMSQREIAGAITAACKELGIEDRITGQSLNTYLYELEHLRVLRREDREYELRDPEIRAILEALGEDGALNELKKALVKREEERLGIESFHPEQARDVIGQTSDGTAELSALNHAQMLEVSETLKECGVVILRGSDGMGLGRLVEAATDYPPVLGPALEGWSVERAEGVSELATDADDAHVLRIVDGVWDQSDVEAALDSSGDALRYVFVAGPERAWELGAYLDGDGSRLLVDLIPWEDVNITQWMRGALGDPYVSVAQELIDRTGGLSNLILRIGDIADPTDPNDLRTMLEAFQGPVMLTDDMSEALSAHPEAYEVARLLAREGGDPLAVSDWCDYFDIDDHEQFLRSVAWLIAMGVLARDDAKDSTELDENSVIRAASWATYAFADDADAPEGSEQ